MEWFINHKLKVLKTMLIIKKKKRKLKEKDRVNSCNMLALDEIDSTNK